MLLLLALVFIFVDKAYNEFAIIRHITAYVFTPVQYLAATPINLTHNIANYFSSKNHLLFENEKLRQENLLLRASMQRNKFLENENAALHSLFNSANKLHDTFILTKILAFDFSACCQQLIIDKGKNDNLYIGQGVLDANGVVGQINFIGPTSSKVLLLSDAKSAIPVMDVRNGLQAIVLGIGNPNVLELTNVVETMDVQVGDLLVSSAFNKNFPEGYPVGVITEIKHLSGEAFAKIKVMPSAHLARARYLILVNKH